MNKTKNTVSFSIFFIFVFRYVGKNSNLRGIRRYFILLKIPWIPIFGWLDPANTKDDLNYLRSIQPTQERQMVYFFKQIEETIYSKGINAHINFTTKELSLKIASKRSNQSAKIYDVGRKGKFLKFEIGIRKKLIGEIKN